MTLLCKKSLRKCGKCTMTAFEQTLQEIDKLCRAHGIPYAVIVGIAANIYGYVRSTVDIDITIS